MQRPYRTAAGITGVVLSILLGLYLVVRLRVLVVVLLVAGMAAIAIDQPVGWVERRLRGSRRAAVALVSVASVLVFAAVVALVIQPFRSQSKSFVEGLPANAERLKELPVVGPPLRNVDIERSTRRFLEHLPEQLAAEREFLLGAAETTLLALAVTGTTTVMTVFLLLKGPPLVESAAALILDDVRRARARRLGRGIKAAVGGWVLGNLAISLVASTVVVVTVLGVPFVPVFAVIMFVLDLIPLVGATLGTAVIAVATFVLDPEPWKSLVFVGVFVVYQQLENHTIYPVLMGRRVKVDALAVFTMVLAGAQLGGILGALLAIPLGAALNVVLRDLLEERRNKGGLAPSPHVAVVDTVAAVAEPEDAAEPVTVLLGEAKDGETPRSLVDPHGRPLVARAGDPDD